MIDPDWGDPIEYDPGEMLTPEQYESERHKERIEEDRIAHLNNLLWNHFAGHYGRDGSLVIPIRFQGE